MTNECMEAAIDLANRMIERKPCDDRPLAMLARSAEALGFVDKHREPGGVTRHTREHADDDMLLVLANALVELHSENKRLTRSLSTARTLGRHSGRRK